jgi:hypothetical protein
MASERQIRANRLNAQKSTGPRTNAGKAASSKNALRHGLTAQQVVLEGEDVAMFQALRDRFLREFQPAGAMEEFLVERLIGLAWRLRRVPLFEAALLSWVAHRMAESQGRMGIMLGDIFLSSDPFPPAQQQHDGDPREVHDRRLIGRMLEAALSNDDLLSKLARYEGLLMKQVEKTLAELRQLIAEREEIERLAKDAEARARCLSTISPR